VFQVAEMFAKEHDSGQNILIKAKKGSVSFHKEKPNQIFWDVRVHQDGAQLTSEELRIHDEIWMFRKAFLKKIQKEHQLTLKAPEILFYPKEKKLECPEKCEILIDQNKLEVDRFWLKLGREAKVSFENLQGAVTP
jgi:hypothetical protein